MHACIFANWNYLPEFTAAIILPYDIPAERLGIIAVEETMRPVSRQ
jgi:hypothetical protein